MKDLDTLGGTDGVASLINDHGQIMGQFYANGGAAVDPILWQADGSPVDLGTLGGTYGNPWFMNNRGQVVGNSNLAGDATHHGFLWDRGTLTDLATLGGDNSEANSINDSGVVVGRADVPGSLTHHGVVWARKHGVMTTTDLGVIGGDACSTAYSINSDGVIVGDAGICFVGGRAWLSDNGGPMLDLNDLALPGSGLHLQDARLINDRGEIVCTGVLPNGDLHAVLLIPVDDDDSATAGRGGRSAGASLHCQRNAASHCSRGGAIGSTCAACHRRANSSQRGNTKKANREKKHEFQNMDAHHRSDSIRRTGAASSVGGAGHSQTTSTPAIPSLPSQRRGHVWRALERTAGSLLPPLWRLRQSRHSGRLCQHSRGRTHTAVSWELQCR